VIARVLRVRHLLLPLVLTVPGAPLAAAPWLTPQQVTALTAAAPACTWRFDGMRPHAGEGRIERWRAEGCGRVPPANFRLARTDEASLTVTTLLPGTTEQPPAVQNDTMLAILGRAAAPDCRDRRVADTALLEATAEGDVERWQVVVCGRRLAYRVTFAATASGPPVVAIEPMPAAPENGH
jgi:hypothetical protein